MLNNFFKVNKKLSKKASIKFLLPLDFEELKFNFRGKKKFQFNIIYEIGCYIIDLMWHLNVVEFTTKIKCAEYFDNKVLKKIEVEILGKDLELTFSIGYDKKYTNCIKVFTKKTSLIISPFFWGRKSSVFIEYNKLNNSKNITINENNLYEKLIKTWLNEKNNNLIKDLNNVHRYKFIIYKLCEIEKLVKNSVL